MMTAAPDHAGRPADHRPMAGLKAWLITDGKAGMDTQVRGVADALGLDSTFKHVTPQGIQKLLSPYARVARAEKFGAAEGPFAPPWPDVALATGRLSIPYLRALRKSAGLATYTVVLQDPKMGAGVADLVWVPQHDKLRGANVVTSLTPPHSFTSARLSDLRRTMPADIAALPGPRVAVILGGKNGVYKFTDHCDDRLEASLAGFARLGASFMITPSRRTHDRLLRAVDRATANAPRVLWRGEGDNPYAQFLAHADALIVTADSVNMCGEAAATGRPIYVFTPSGGSAKFRRYHAALEAYGATRALPAAPERLDTWAYAPLDGAADVAVEVARRYQRRQHMLGPAKS